MEGKTGGKATSLNIKIEPRRSSVKKIYELPGEIADELDFYVELAKRVFPGSSEIDIVAAMLSAHMKRDKFFQEELLKRTGEKKKGRPRKDDSLGLV